jgi:hypothetical protein
VAVATFKIDGLFFLLGTFFGILVFAETLSGFETFWLNAGALGRFTLPDALGVPWGVVVAGVVVMALLVFKGVEALERRFARLKPEENQS